MIRQGYEIRAFHNPYRHDAIEIHLVRYANDGSELHAVNQGEAIGWEIKEPHAPVTPILTILPDRAQQLIDDLWGAGLRPTQGKQSEGVTAAQARHLEDMRSIAFGKLNMEKPE